MAIYNTQYLTNLAESRAFSQTDRMFTESRETLDFDIFLSHSFLDRSVIKGLFIELKSMGFKVYVDWIVDPHLDRNNITKESAELIRNRMKSSKSLLLAVSTNAVTSKWMPWELGFADGHSGKCAVLPVSDQVYAQNSYTGFEYLKLYPFVKKQVNMSQQEKLWVIESATKYVVLEDFIFMASKPYERTTKIF